jgi:hypothetical protein
VPVAGDSNQEAAMKTFRRLGVAALAGMALAAAACSKSDVLEPFHPQITNAADNFQFAVKGLNGVTATREFPWQNTGQIVDVGQAAQLTGGTATVTVFDAALTQVYSGDLARPGTFWSISGPKGSWRIRVELQNATGNVDFRVTKKQ